MSGGSQPMSLNVDGCIYAGTVAHEFLHALGKTNNRLSYLTGDN